MNRIVVRNIGQMVTMCGPARGRFGGEMSKIGLVDDAEIHIEDTKIVFAGSRLDAHPFSNAIEIDAEGNLVTPGLVDAHTHAVFAGNRADEFEARAMGATYQEIAAGGGGILSTV
ncbi:MAG: amidohydrolase family protein, partial [Armatimonadota bacterium]